MKTFEKISLFALLMVSLFFTRSLCVSIEKDRAIPKPELKIAEMVVDVQPDSVFGGYRVEIKRLELVESKYWLHTNKKYEVGQTNKVFVPSTEQLSFHIPTN